MHQHVSAIYLRAPHRDPYLHLHKQLRRLTYFLFLLFLFSLTSCDNGVAAQRKEGRTYPLLATIPKTSFTCRGHTAGYYADPETDCQVYHMCDTLEKQYSYLCPNYTLFNQKFMVCDHWYMVNCSSSTSFYDLNDHIGDVPESGGDSDKKANDISLDVNRKTPGSSRQSFEKDSKSSSAAFSFKSPGSSLLQPRITTNSLVTERTATVPNNGFSRTITAPVNSFALRKSTLPRPLSQSRPQIFSAKIQSTIRTTPQPIVTTNKPQSLSTRAKQIPNPTESPFISSHSQASNRPQTFSAKIQSTIRTTPQHIGTTNKPQSLSTRAKHVPNTTEIPFISSHSQTSNQPPTFSQTKSPFSVTSQTQTLRTTFEQSSRPTTTPRSITAPNTTPISGINTQQTSKLDFRPITSPFRLSPTTTTSFPQTSKPAVKPIAAPSRFFQLPNVESIFQSRSNELVKIPPPPSVFFETPRRDTGINSGLIDQDGPDAGHVHSDKHHGIPFLKGPQPGSPFTMVPGVVARGSGNRFTFSSNTGTSPFNDLAFNDVIFRPLVIRPKTRKIFTSAPASITLDPHHHALSTSTDQDSDHSTNAVFAAPLGSKFNSTVTNLTSIRVPSTILQPPPFVPVTLNVPPFLPPPQQSLVPPQRMKQEFPTLLEIPGRFGFTQRHHLSGGVNSFPSTPSRFHFPVSRSNRDFFIPPSGLSLPKEDSPIGLTTDLTTPKNKVAEIQNNLLLALQQKKTSMTMVFPEPRKIKETTLQINPKCPKCHPAFLRPGECTPCVLIR